MTEESRNTYPVTPPYDASLPDARFVDPLPSRIPDALDKLPAERQGKDPTVFVEETRARAARIAAEKDAQDAIERSEAARVAAEKAAETARQRLVELRAAAESVVQSRPAVDPVVEVARKSEQPPSIQARILKILTDLQKPHIGEDAHGAVKTAVIGLAHILLEGAPKN